MLHKPAPQQQEDPSAMQKSLLGLKLFFIYALIYAGFVFIGLSKPALMGMRILMGLNLAIVYGFGLILLAIVMGFLYHKACSRMEDKMKQGKEETHDI